MALVRDRDGRRLHVKSKLMGQSLISKTFMKDFKIAPQHRLFPDVTVIKIGGQSICDRGIKALPGVVKEIGANKTDHKMLITTGGGTRSRHIYAIGLELGMPTGIIAKFGSSVSEQNALLVSTLLAPWGGIKIGHDEIMENSKLFYAGFHSGPAWHASVRFLRHPRRGVANPRAPDGCRDRDPGGLIGARTCILLKDEKGLYTDDPKKKDNVRSSPR